MAVRVAIQINDSCRRNERKRKTNLVIVKQNRKSDNNTFIASMSKEESGQSPMEV